MRTSGARHGISEVDLGVIVLLPLGWWAHNLVVKMFWDIAMLFHLSPLFSIVD